MLNEEFEETMDDVGRHILSMEVVRMREALWQLVVLKFDPQIRDR